MRHGQQHRRGRGRNNNSSNNNNNNSHNNHSRRNQNPNARNFESTGPDVKIRGTAVHIAEKYLALSRDAQSSGDPVLAENYLQHAEHYHRIIMAYREQQMQQGGGEMMNGGANRPRNGFGGENHETSDEFSDDDMDDGVGENFNGPVRRNDHQANQPQQQPRLADMQPRSDEMPVQQPPREPQPRDRPPREQSRQSRDRFGEPRGYRDRRPEPGGEPAGAARAADTGGPDSGGGRRRNERVVQPADEQPEFLRRPVRRPRREVAEGANGNTTANGSASASTESDTSSAEPAQPSPRDKPTA